MPPAPSVAPHLLIGWDLEYSGSFYACICNTLSTLSTLSEADSAFPSHRHRKGMPNFLHADVDEVAVRGETHSLFFVAVAVSID